ncbi:carbohydrate ABC transporter permease [Halothermothrix orenii]|uniref:Binding-protein-dependent transport systems inner membrane component n=1 Tax=Halothermothrix orenii (strain H 168 / OCM 544 / DSM 9562) TaxID=373903 RepID=B8CWN7_HALOH|nr:sugar ABC transporter permease [Halothermothrix orenii]ACL69706.1 binding-protein-dependent transport systems inner membrane component [Halothermothrix orenii H 168]
MFLADRSKRRKIYLFLAFVGPIFVLYTLFFILPLFEGIYYSFTDWKGVGGSINWVGFDNYINLFKIDDVFINSINTTFYIAFVNVLLTNILAMIFAIALTNNFKLNNLYRGIILLPNMISMVVSGFIWKFMFSKISGSLYEATGIELFNNSWLGDIEIVIYSVVIVSLWQGLGYIMTIYIAALQGVDENVIEAASIDGANSWQIFFKIKLPLMLPIVSIGAFLNISMSLKIFDIIYSLTGGGPGHASEVAMLNIYREAFVFNRLGYANAKAIVLTIIIVIITVIHFRITSREEVKI